MDAFVMQNMLTCIGNKRKLVSNIYDIVNNLANEPPLWNKDNCDRSEDCCVVLPNFSYFLITSS